VAIIGAGTAGMYALREVQRAGKSFLLIDHGPLGTTCARVGCMPSKLALHTANLWAARKDLAGIGISGAEALRLDTQKAWKTLREKRDGFAGSATRDSVRRAGEFLVKGYARFLEPTTLSVENEGKSCIIRAKAVIIATGSRPNVPAFLEGLSSRLVTTDTLFELPDLPSSMGILGLGAIGLEMGLALSRLGVRVIGADIASTVGGITDPEIRDAALKLFGSEMELWLGTPASAKLSGNSLLMQAGEKENEVEMLLVAMGRRPNMDALNLEAAGFKMDERGIPLFDPASLQVGNYPVFIAGDANASRPLMHESADEGAIAGYNAARGTALPFKRKVLLGIAFTRPDLCNVGASLDELDPDAILIGEARGRANSRARVLGTESDILRIYAAKADGKLLGASILASSGEHLAHEIAWAIQRGETAASLLELPFYHPVVEEMLKSALQKIAKAAANAGNHPLPFGLRLKG
ncbi:dihydrolipoyl dehydrogenase, partial [Desulfococcaceae bacterium OttesenSCG-928-F15]|nr:dihydrolipoyl dehydrogenase [Desulfococcaceae bacterium OttesenSCG-928-F15]